jgi:putative ABC transport system substrate-binding protein
MRRREFIAGLAGAVVGPHIAGAQQTPVPVVGFLHGQTNETTAHLLLGFRAGLQAMGFVEGRNVAIQTTLADGQIDRLPALAADLVRRRVAVIVAAGGLPTGPVRPRRRAPRFR